MRTMIVTAVLSLAVFSGAMAKKPLMTCARQNGAACTAQHVQKLEASVKLAAKGPRAAALADVESISLASSDGTLRCLQTGGKPCTAQQMQSVWEVSRALDLKVTLPPANAN
jgi:hypothetical protein